MPKLTKMCSTSHLLKPRYVFTLVLVCSFLLFGMMINQLIEGIDDELVVNTEESHITLGTHSDAPRQSSKNASVPERLVYYDASLPLIWIGGVPRSGTTLMRAMLDAHPLIRCGEETRVIPRLLGMHSGIEKSEQEMARLAEAHIDSSVLNSALGAYLLSIIAQHGEAAPHLCNKDPFTLRSMSKIHTLFPRSKFLLMIRDGRATVHSIISRKVSIKGFDTKSYRGALAHWNRAIANMYADCVQYGPAVCMPVYYEQLVLHPETLTRRILRFLDIPWNASVLHHEQAIGKKNGVSLSK
jgi:protein-tyrosine sulfotransferase